MSKFKVYITTIVIYNNKVTIFIFLPQLLIYIKYTIMKIGKTTNVLTYILLFCNC